MILVKKEEKTDAVEKEQELTRVEMESNGEIRVDSPKQDLEEPVDEAGGSSQVHTKSFSFFIDLVSICFLSMFSFKVNISS